MANLSGVNKYFSVAKEGFATTTSAPVASGATTVQLSSVAGYSNGDTVVLVIDAGDVAKKQAFTGTVDTGGTQITNVVWTEGANTSHIIGAPVIDYVTASHQSMTTKGLLVSHNQDGTLKAGAVDNAAVLASNVVETPKIKDGAVTGSKITNYKITRQNDTTNTTETTSRILSGWGVISINTSTRTYLETVTFDTAFTGRPIVVGSCGGDGLTANGSTYGKGGSIIVNGWYCKVVEITTSSFQVYLATEAGNPGAAGYLWYQWIAIGV